MAKIIAPYLFSWKDVDELGDLERLKFVLDNLADDCLINRLLKERGKGRNRYPVRAMWNSILAGVVFEHQSIEHLRRELSRNAQLRELCGFNPLQGATAVPTAWAYSRFIKQLVKHSSEIEQLSQALVSQLYEILPGFGENIAADSKAISSHGRPPKSSIVDGRRDTDANWGAKNVPCSMSPNGRKTKHWFGYKLHLLVDADYELPMAQEVTVASKADAPALECLLDAVEEKMPRILEVCQHMMADKAYDSASVHNRLWKQHRIKPIIDIRDLTRDGDKSWLIHPRYPNITCDNRGGICCHCPLTGQERPMPFAGFEKGREALKFLCPVEHYGVSCKGQIECPVKKAIRVPLAADPRTLSPLPRSTYKWRRLYNKRSAVERVNSRFDVSFGFERHFIRGLKKMRMRCSLASLVMLSIAVGHAKAKRPELIRSLVKAA